jgi:hypothetical protein
MLCALLFPLRSTIRNRVSYLWCRDNSRYLIQTMWGIIQKKDTHTLDFDVTLRYLCLDLHMFLNYTHAGQTSSSFTIVLN